MSENVRKLFLRYLVALHLKGFEPVDVYAGADEVACIVAKDDKRLAVRYVKAPTGVVVDVDPEVNEIVGDIFDRVEVVEAEVDPNNMTVLFKCPKCGTEYWVTLTDDLEYKTCKCGTILVPWF